MSSWSSHRLGFDLVLLKNIQPHQSFAHWLRPECVRMRKDCGMTCVCASARKYAFVYICVDSFLALQHRALSSRRVYFGPDACLCDTLGGVWATAASDLCSIQITHQLECLCFLNVPHLCCPCCLCFLIQPSAPPAKDPRGAVVRDRLASLPPDR